MLSAGHIIPDPKGLWNDFHPNLEIKEGLVGYSLHQQGMLSICFQETYGKGGRLA